MKSKKQISREILKHWCVFHNAWKMNETLSIDPPARQVDLAKQVKHQNEQRVRTSKGVKFLSADQ